MRRAFADALGQLIGPHGSNLANVAGRTARLARLGMKALAARTPRLLRPFVSPILATVAVTHRCNLACPFCETNRPNDEAGAPDRLERRIAEIADLGAVAVGFTGGEPLLDPAAIPALAAAARLGLVTHLNTNATSVDEDAADALVAAGLGSINVSLDAAEAEVHDRVRGPGSFADALRGARLLVAARDRLRSRLRIRAVMALGPHNAAECEPLIDLASRLGLDGCSFIPVHGRPSTAPSSSPEASAAAARLANRASERLVDNSRRYLEGMAAFFEGHAMPSRCSALTTSIVVDPTSAVFPCVPAANRAAVLRRLGAPPGPQRDGIPLAGKTLREIFKSGRLEDTLDAALCSACWWNCHRELDIALGIL